MEGTVAGFVFVIVTGIFGRMDVWLFAGFAGLKILAEKRNLGLKMLVMHLLQLTFWLSSCNFYVGKLLVVSWGEGMECEY